MEPKRLTVLGVGLLGGSLGLALKALSTNCTVIGYGHRAASLQEAVARGAIDESYDDPARAVEGADWVVLCTPVGMLAELLDRIAPALEARAIVTDVGSTKRGIVTHASARHPQVRFVGSHPMAGSEKRGVEHAQTDLFRGTVCITTPVEASDPSAVDEVDAFWQRLGMRVRRLSPVVHDRLISDVSHLPHAVAAALLAMQDGEALELAGRGFADVTRIAGGDGGLWRDIFLDNRDNLRASILRMQNSLQELLHRLDGEDADAAKQWLDGAAERRQKALGRSRFEKSVR